MSLDLTEQMLSIILTAPPWHMWDHFPKLGLMSICTLPCSGQLCTLIPCHLFSHIYSFISISPLFVPFLFVSECPMSPFISFSLPTSTSLLSPSLNCLLPQSCVLFLAWRMQHVAHVCPYQSKVLFNGDLTLNREAFLYLFQEKRQDLLDLWGWICEKCLSNRRTLESSTHTLQLCLS